MANGSRRRLPTAPMFAEVVSDAAVAPGEHAVVPGICLGHERHETLLLLPPKMKMSMDTPSGFSQSGQMIGLCEAGAVKRAFAWAASSLLAGDPVAAFPV